MKIFEIKKRSGGTRVIYAPNKTAKQTLRNILRRNLNVADFGKYAHGFVRGRNIVTNAQQHVGKKLSICFDISDFFDSITPDKVAGKVSQYVIENCFPDGVAHQGFPTSPALANIASKEMDIAIVKQLFVVGVDAVYTRYADDMTISTDNPLSVSDICSIVNEIVKKYGFEINPKKTHIQYASNGRREICGITVSDTIHVPRRIKRKLRAAEHNYKTNPSKKNLQRRNGLREFAKLKVPNNYTDAGHRGPILRRINMYKQSAMGVIRPTIKLVRKIIMPNFN